MPKFLKLTCCGDGFVISNPDSQEENFLSWYLFNPEKRRHKNSFVQQSSAWTKVLIQEYLYQLFVPLMRSEFFPMNEISTKVVIKLFLTWIKEMATFLVKLSPSFQGLPAAISSCLSSSYDLSMECWTRNPVILCKILQVSQGRPPRDIIQHIVPGCDYVCGPWLHHQLAKATFSLDLHGQFSAPYPPGR